MSFMERNMPSTKREQLVDTAIDLFYRDGFHATGIDKILAESGVAKMTLYKHFKSKDELILAALRKRDEIFRNQFMQDVESRAKKPRERLLAMFDTLEDWFADKDFSGCIFINAAAEYPEMDNPIHTTCAENKRLLVKYVIELAEQAGAKDANLLGNGLSLLIEGAVIMYYVGNQKNAAKQAKASAQLLMQSAGL
jgi:AcrR family transcriptional regulator